MGPPIQINQVKLSRDPSLHCSKPVLLTAYALLVSRCMYLSHQTSAPSREGSGDGLQARRDPICQESAWVDLREPYTGTTMGFMEVVPEINTCGWYQEDRLLLRICESAKERHNENRDKET